MKSPVDGKRTRRTVGDVGARQREQEIKPDVRPVGDGRIGRAEAAAVCRDVPHDRRRNRRSVNDELHARNHARDSREKTEHKVQPEQHFKKRQPQRQRSDHRRRQQPESGNGGGQVGCVPDLQATGSQQQAADEETGGKNGGGHGAFRCAGSGSTTSLRAPRASRRYNTGMLASTAPLARAFTAASTAVALVALLAGCAHRPSAPDFVLTDDAGRPWALSSQQGHPVLLTFGYSRCADTCPTILAKLVHVARALGPRGKGVEVAMISVDPRHDTPAALHRFVRRFDGPVIGLTGSPAQIATVESAYHVWSQPIPTQRFGKDGDVAHSAIVYFIDTRGTVRGIYDDDDSPSALTTAARPLL